MPKQLNFFPYYEELLASGDKTTTFRLPSSEPFAVGDKVSVTVGWALESAKEVRQAEISKMYEKKVAELDEYDFDGESPDCKSPYPTALVLSAIYRTVVALDDTICVVKYRYIDDQVMGSEATTK